MRGNCSRSARFRSSRSVAQRHRSSPEARIYYGMMSGLCQERAVRRDAVRKMRVVPRSRLVGGGFKQPEAASAKSRGGERSGQKA